MTITMKHRCLLSKETFCSPLLHPCGIRLQPGYETIDRCLPVCIGFQGWLSFFENLPGRVLPAAGIPGKEKDMNTDGKTWLASRPLTAFGAAAWVLAALLGIMAILTVLAEPAGAQPTIEILSPEPGSTLSGTVDVRVRMHDPVGMRQLWVKAGNHATYDRQLSDRPATYLVEMKWDTTLDYDGEALMLCDGWNSNNQYSHLTEKFIINNAGGPSINWDTPHNGEVFTDEDPGRTTVSARLSRERGAQLRKTSLFINGKEADRKIYFPPVDSTTYEYSLNLDSLEEGMHTLKLVTESTEGARALESRVIYRVGELTSCYLAEGSTAWGFSTYLSVVNPNPQPATILITYQTAEGARSRPHFQMAPFSQATVNPADDLGEMDFSTRIDCLEGMDIAADRTMIWNSGGGEDAHCSIGVNEPATTWYLPEGSTAWGFETWLLIQNPGRVDANCTITYMIENEGHVTIPVTVSKHTRSTFNMSRHIGSRDASIRVVSDVPVIPERSMYRNNRRCGHDSVGTTSPALEYYLAEGATGYNVGYITYVLVQNPQEVPAGVNVTFMTAAGERQGPSFSMPPLSRKTLRLNDLLPPETDVSTRVSADVPIIAERSMYWNNGTGEAGHDSIGIRSPGKTFYLPDGETTRGRETWTLVQNPGNRPVEVEMTYLADGGTRNVVKTETIPPASRRSFDMARHSGISGRAGVMVQSISGGDIICERAMYWNDRGAGTNTIGGQPR